MLPGGMNLEISKTTDAGSVRNYCYLQELDMDTLQILEGGFDQHDSMKDRFMNMGMEILPDIANLYDEPEKLKELETTKPDFIYLRTTGLDINGRAEARGRLIEVFESLNYLPDNVIFFDDETAFNFLSTAKKLEKLGTRFWFPPFSSYNPELRPINWISK